MKVVLKNLSSVIIIAALALLSVASGIAAQPAKQLFGAKRLPTTLQPASYGFYTKGCLAGGIAIPHNGPNWQAMRPSRNRRWGHPNLVSLIERLSIDAKKHGWNGLMVGDISQPRGGPMLTGHASHLQRRFGKSDHAAGTNRVGRHHTSRGVDGQFP